MRSHAITRVLVGAVATVAIAAPSAQALDNRGPVAGSTVERAVTAPATSSGDGLSEPVVVTVAALGGLGLAGAAYGTRRRHVGTARGRNQAHGA